MVNNRCIICMAPVQAVKGKFTKSKYRFDAARYGSENACVGFTNKWSPANRYRFISGTYTVSASKIAQVNAHRQKFAAVAALARDRMADPTKRAVDEAAWKAQTKYATFFGYIFHEEWLTYEP